MINSKFIPVVLATFDDELSNGRIFHGDEVITGCDWYQQGKPCIYEAREYSLVPEGFLTAPLLQKL